MFNIPHKISQKLGEMKAKLEIANNLDHLKVYCVENCYSAYPVLLNKPPVFADHVQPYVIENVSEQLPSLPTTTEGKVATQNMSLEHQLELAGVLGIGPLLGDIRVLGYYTPFSDNPFEYDNAYRLKLESLTKGEVQIPDDIDRIVLWYSTFGGIGQLQKDDVDGANLLLSRLSSASCYYLIHARVADTFRWYGFVPFGEVHKPNGKDLTSPKP